MKPKLWLVYCKPSALITEWLQEWSEHIGIISSGELKTVEKNMSSVPKYERWWGWLGWYLKHPETMTHRLCHRFEKNYRVNGTMPRNWDEQQKETKRHPNTLGTLAATDLEAHMTHILKDWFPCRPTWTCAFFLLQFSWVENTILQMTDVDLHWPTSTLM